MISISKQYSFDAAHQLINNELTDEGNQVCFGKCFRKHGHTYTLTVEIAGLVNPPTGMILNYFNLDGIVKRYVDSVLDHQDLNDLFPDMLTTAENMVKIIAQEIGDALWEIYPAIELVSVTLSETPKTTAKWQA